MTLRAFRGSIFHMLGEPEQAAQGAYDYFPDGFLVVDGGFVKAAGPAQSIAPTLPAGVPCEEFPDALIVPGFVDTHIHYPQCDIVAAHGKCLMGWLETYTFPVEREFADAGRAGETAQFFLEELLRNGTTAALVFATVHSGAVNALFEAAERRRMRIVTGKVMMDRNAPGDLLDSPGGGHDESRALIKQWHGKARLSYAVTPRFAVTSSAAQLMAAGRLLREFGDVYLQTHLAESAAEIALIASLFPQARDYLDVYARHGLLTGRSVFAHGVHLTADAMARLAAAKASIAFCPTSNLFLGSGLFDIALAKVAGVSLGLGTDVGGGTSFSLFATMNEAYKVGQLRGETLHALQVFYLATLGGARALKLDGRIGNFEAGKEADFLVLDRKATPLLARRLARCRSIEEEIFALSILGDDRVVARTYLMGELAHRRSPDVPTMFPSRRLKQ